MLGRRRCRAALRVEPVDQQDQSSDPQVENECERAEATGTSGLLDRTGTLDGGKGNEDDDGVEAGNGSVHANEGGRNQLYVVPGRL